MQKNRSINQYKQDNINFFIVSIGLYYIISEQYCGFLLSDFSDFKDCKLLNTHITYSISSKHLA